MPLSESRQEIDFGIEIKFDKGSIDPARVFRSMSALIESFQDFDRALARTIDIDVEPVLMLEDIEAGSLRTWLRDVINVADDQTLKSGDWKKLLGAYLVRGKYILVRFLEGKKAISSREDISNLQIELVKAAEETQLRGFAVYQAMPTPRLLGSIQELNSALAQLSKTDRATFISREGDASLNLDLAFSLHDVEDLLTRETISNEGQVILKVKKPDYLGESMWEFRFEGGPLEAKILDFDWLSRFQKREVDVRPGDAIRVTMKSESRYGYDGEVVGVRYSIVRVVEVIHFNPPTQASIEIS